VLATYREIVSRGQWTPKLTVRLSMSIVAIYPEGTVPQFQIWIENHGRCDLLFNSNSVSIGMQGSDTALLVVDPVSNVKFPHTLKPGGSFYFMKERGPLLEALRRMPGAGASVAIRGVIWDAISRPFYSEWQDVPLAETQTHQP